MSPIYVLSILRQDIFVDDLQLFFKWWLMSESAHHMFEDAYKIVYTFGFYLKPNSQFIIKVIFIKQPYEAVFKL